MENQQKRGQLTGKKVIILGGSSGLGRATATAAAAEGANVIIVSSNQPRIDQALSELPSGSEGYAVDLSQEQNIRSFFDRIGNFDHLVYTAGENIVLNTIPDTNLQQAREFFNLRFWGPYAAVKYGAKYINPGGSVGLIGGIANPRPGKGWSLAAAICGAMEGLTRALAVELAPLRVNIVTPGVVRTNLWNSMPESDRENYFKSVGDALLVGRIGEAADIAQTFVYLMKAGFTTGQALVVDGGAVLI